MSQHLSDPQKSRCQVYAEPPAGHQRGLRGRAPSSGGGGVAEHSARALQIGEGTPAVPTSVGASAGAHILWGTRHTVTQKPNLLFSFGAACFPGALCSTLPNWSFPLMVGDSLTAPLKYESLSLYRPARRHQRCQSNQDPGSSTLRSTNIYWRTCSLLIRPVFPWGRLNQQ